MGCYFLPHVLTPITAKRQKGLPQFPVRFAIFRDINLSVLPFRQLTLAMFQPWQATPWCLSRRLACSATLNTLPLPRCSNAKQATPVVAISTLPLKAVDSLVLVPIFLFLSSATLVQNR